MFSCDQTVLLVVDIQGRLARIVQDSASVLKSLEILIKGMQILDVPSFARNKFHPNSGRRWKRFKK